MSDPNRPDPEMPDPGMSGPIASGRTITGRDGGNGREARTAGSAEALDLQAFFPYRLAVLAEQVSLALAAVYSERFRLSRQEWRILAQLGTHTEIAATAIGRAVTLDKMQVSRALQGLEARGIVKRSEAAGDRRKKIVSLTAAGRALYRRIAPLALRREAAILRGLSPRDIRQLAVMMDKIASAASGFREGARG